MNDQRKIERKKERKKERKIERQIDSDGQEMMKQLKVKMKGKESITQSQSHKITK